MYFDQSSSILEQTHSVNSSESDDHTCNQLIAFSLHCGMGLSAVRQVLTAFVKLKTAWLGSPVSGSVYRSSQLWLGILICGGALKKKEISSLPENQKL